MLLKQEENSVSALGDHLQYPFDNMQLTTNQ